MSMLPDPAVTDSLNCNWMFVPTATEAALFSGNDPVSVGAIVSGAAEVEKLSVAPDEIPAK